MNIVHFLLTHVYLIKFLIQQILNQQEIFVTSYMIHVTLENLCTYLTKAQSSMFANNVWTAVGYYIEFACIFFFGSIMYVWVFSYYNFASFFFVCLFFWRGGVLTNKTHLLKIYFSSYTSGINLTDKCIGDVYFDSSL